MIVKVPTGPAAVEVAVAAVVAVDVGLVVGIVDREVVEVRMQWWVVTVERIGTIQASALHHTEVH